MRWLATVWLALLAGYRRVRDRLVDWMPGSTPGSQLRNFMSFTGFLVCAAFGIEILLAQLGLPFLDASPSLRRVAVFWAGYSVVLFGVVVLSVVYLHNEDYPIAAGRLIRDVCISALTVIVTFAVLYRYLGISTGVTDALKANMLCFTRSDCVCDAGPTDHLYFSIVTFSTLGFGDYTACTARLVSASQALLGNLHLGMFVGAVFYYLTETRASGSR